jgi:hypothetical protein
VQRRSCERDAAASLLGVLLEAPLARGGPVSVGLRHSARPGGTATTRARQLRAREIALLPRLLTARGGARELRHTSSIRRWSTAAAAPTFAACRRADVPQCLRGSSAPRWKQQRAAGRAPAARGARDARARARAPAALAPEQPEAAAGERPKEEGRAASRFLSLLHACASAAVLR